MTPRCGQMMGYEHCLLVFYMNILAMVLDPLQVLTNICTVIKYLND